MTFFQEIDLLPGILASKVPDLFCTIELKIKGNDLIIINRSYIFHIICRST